MVVSIDNDNNNSSSSSSIKTKKTKEGHDSVEDANAALMLSILKANLGPFFPRESNTQSASLRVSLHDHVAQSLGQYMHTCFIHVIRNFISHVPTYHCVSGKSLLIYI